MSQEDRIAKTFKDKAVFVTGGSGFLGKVLIEKLLRCTEVAKIYLLLRNKKGKRPQERLEEIFNNVLFRKLKETKPGAIKKCCVIPGDVSEVDLGISFEDRKILQNNVQFIFHSAASTRFDDSVRVAVKINTRGTKYVLDLAKQCPKLKSFIHVSTAFAYPFETICYEKAYKPPADPYEIIEKIDFDKKDDEVSFDHLMKDFPNTYIFSKALAEGLVVDEMDNLPILIARPSVVCPVFKDPLPGWCNNLQGPMGLFVGAGKGVIRSVYINKDGIADFIPADVVINALLIASWQIAELNINYKFVNCVTSNELSFTWERLIELGKDIVYNDTPFNMIAWYPGGTLESSKIIHTINFYLFQLIPAIFIDLFLFIFGYKPFLFQIQKRIRSGLQMFEYFAIKNWAFACTRTDETRKMLNDTEREIYKIDANNIDVRKYLRECILCVRRNILKETDDMLPKARLVMKIMYVVDRACKAFVLFAALHYFYKYILVPLFLRR